MKETKIILVRHGESLGNAGKILLGRTDLDLSELGYLQAEACAKFLSCEHIDEIHSSSLMRAMHTAEPHAKIRGMQVMPNDNLREIFLGDWENKTVDEIVEKWGYDSYYVDWQHGYGTFVCPNGEGVMECGERFYREVEKIAKAAEGKTVLVAAHGAVIRTFWAIVLGIAPEDIAAAFPFPSNASCSYLTYSDGKFVAEEYSYNEYLSEVGITNINF